MEILVDEKNAEILRLYEQLKAKDRQLSEKRRADAYQRPSDC